MLGRDSAVGRPGAWRRAPIGRRRRRAPEAGSAAAFPSSGCRHGAAARRAGGVRAAARAGRAAARQPAAAAGRLARPRPQRHRAGAARLGLRRPARAAGALRLPPRGVRGVRGAGGPRRERDGAAGAGPRLREVRRTGLRRGGPDAGAVPGAGRHRVRRAAGLPAGQPALPQVHRALLHNHPALLLLPGLLRRGPVLPGPHRDGRGEAADAGGPGDLVVRGPDPAHHRRADAQRRQQLVHRVLRAAALAPRGTDGASPGLEIECLDCRLARTWTDEASCDFPCRAVTLVSSSVQTWDTKLAGSCFACLK